MCTFCKYKVFYYLSHSEVKLSVSRVTSQSNIFFSNGENCVKIALIC